MVAMSLLTHQSISKFVLLFMQHGALNPSSFMSHNSFCGCPIFTLAVPTQATPRSLMSFRIFGHVTWLSIATTHFHLSCSSNPSVRDNAVPAIEVFSRHPFGTNPVREQQTEKNLWPSLMGLFFILTICLERPLNASSSH